MEDSLNLNKYNKVLITGGAGFIGSHIVDLLIENGYEIFVVDNLSSGSESNLNKSAKFYNLDMTSEKLEEVFAQNKIDYVFHLAAQPSVSSSIKNPTYDATENILGSINVLKFAKKYGVKKIACASTAAVYGIPQYLPVDENHNTECLSFYGISKLTMEKYIELFGVDYIIFRLANVYGPRQNAHGEAGVVAIFVDKMKNNENITIDGDGEQTRDFVYVADVAKAFLSAIQSEVKNEIINVSTNTSISINKLFEVMNSNYNYTKKPQYGEERQGDIKHSVLDNKKCLKSFGFIPKTPIEQGLGDLASV